jgi:hypothetical protein
MLRHTGTATALRIVPTVAAIAASTGDLLLLHVAAAPRANGSDVQLAWMVLAGHYLGVLAIPAYALGYWQVAAAITRPRLARATFVLGAAGAILGTAIHGITGVIIAASRTAPASTPPAAAPFAGMNVLAGYAEFLVPLWLLVAAALIAGSVVFAVATATGASCYPRWTAALNPAALVVYIAVLGTVVRAPLIAPAAPNLAHIAFFAVTAWLDGRTRL